MNNRALWQHTISENSGQAKVTVDTGRQSAYRISPLLRGKFCEHLRANIYGGMEAQILVNPTFGHWPFNAGDFGGDGGMRPESDMARRRELSAQFARQQEFPDPDSWPDDFLDGGAFGWLRVGTKTEVSLSPDVGPHGGRAQRIEVTGAGGIQQWTYLPLHRTRRFQFRLIARSAAPVDVTLALSSTAKNLASLSLPLTNTWATHEGVLEIPADAVLDDAGLFLVSLTVAKSANIVIDRLLLYPDDHVGHADPDVIERLRESRLPLLRWPGGNFVSGYNWRDGIGPVDARPTRPNPAWGALEYNFFGTAEFIEFCRAIGCEPMICVNAGDGTPEGAAAWVEYCNGSGDTPMGRLRAEHGFPEPFGIRYWEVGNELFGRWQVSWTTPGGHVDRYQRFAPAMLGADPSILLLACGYPWWENNAWDTRAIEDIGPDLRCLTDHILTGGDVNAATDPAELYHAFVGQSVDIGQRYRAVGARMQEAGVAEPRLAITELQLFSHFQATPADENALEGTLSPATIPTPVTISEALYFTTIFHECVRMEGLVEMITHSATVNHGGGLRKTRERVWTNPVHHAHTLLALLDGAVPVALHVESAAFSTKTAFVNMPPLTDVPVVDALAALSEDGASLIVTLAHRAAHTGPITVTLDFGDFPAADKVEAITVAGESMSDQNTHAQPERIVPQESQVALTNGQGKITLPPYSFTRLIVEGSTKQ